MISYRGQILEALCLPVSDAVTLHALRKSISGDFEDFRGLHQNRVTALMDPWRQ